MTTVQKSLSRRRSSLSRWLANELTARCSKLIYRIFFLFFFHFGGYGYAFLIKGSGCDAIAKGGNRNESDLLHEIDKALRIGRGFLLGQGAFAILITDSMQLYSEECHSQKVSFPSLATKNFFFCKRY